MSDTASQQPGTTPDLITADLVIADLVAADKGDATRQLADTLVAAGRVTDRERFLADVAAREEQMATGIPGGIGLPHARSEAVTVPSLAVGRVVSGERVDFGAPDGPANLVFLIAAPTTGESDHLTILAALARKLVHASFRQSLLEAPDAASVASTVLREVYGR
ncbi:PTS sugar transporter subunit IIA [Kineococcus sp. SYSU DK004]|uniref:PTS sugar transporter subunit IIA n=1 Tax=Kineococcus sp. SYSU DK004 TaxID=3383125 RepID=UPI003D7E7A89